MQTQNEHTPKPEKQEHKFEVGDIVYANGLGVEKAHLDEFASYLIVTVGIDPRYIKVCKNENKTGTYYPAEYFFRKAAHSDTPF